MFLSNTLNGIIKRFEDEFPDTRLSESIDSAIEIPDKEEDDDEEDKATPPPDVEDPTKSAAAAMASGGGAASDEDESATAIRSPCLSRSNSALSLNSKALADEEGRVLRAGHKFRAGVASPEDLSGPPRSEHYALLTSGVEMVGADPNHARLLHELLEEELGDDEALRAEVREKGVVAVFKERRREILNRLREADPAHWDRFVESQEMARANVKLKGEASNGNAAALADADAETAVED